MMERTDLIFNSLQFLSTDFVFLIIVVGFAWMFCVTMLSFFTQRSLRALVRTGLFIVYLALGLFVLFHMPERHLKAPASVSAVVLVFVLQSIIAYIFVAATTNIKAENLFKL